jgi:hypothetical protein
MFWFVLAQVTWSEAPQVRNWCISRYCILYISQLMLLYWSTIHTLLAVCRPFTCSGWCILLTYICYSRHSVYDFKKQCCARFVNYLLVFIARYVVIINTSLPCWLTSSYTITFQSVSFQCVYVMPSFVITNTHAQIFNIHRSFGINFFGSNWQEHSFSYRIGKTGHCETWHV